MKVAILSPPYINKVAVLVLILEILTNPSL